MQTVKSKTLTLFFLLLIITGVAHSNAAAHPPFSSTAQKGDRVIATKTLTGKLKGFEVGDYVHAVIKLPNGKEKSFFINGMGVDYFLALHKDEAMVITYQIVDSYIEEAGGRMRIERITSVKLGGGLTSSAWWKQVRAKNSTAGLEKKYGGLVESLKLNP